MGLFTKTKKHWCKYCYKEYSCPLGKSRQDRCQAPYEIECGNHNSQQKEVNEK